MKRYITPDNVIKITMYLYPEIYSDFEYIASAVSYDARSHRYHTDVNPLRIINGPLSEYGQQLEPPIKEEYEYFIDDCIWLVKELGFTIIDQHRSEDSKKSRCILVYGIDDSPCGTIVYDLRLSDHPFDATFPEEWKETALEYLKMNNILDGSATKAGIDFRIEKVTVGSHRTDTWDKAFNRLYLLLKRMRNKVQIRLRER